METISHNFLVYSLKIAIMRHGKGLPELCHEAGIKEQQLTAVLDGTRFVTADLIAGLGRAFKIDYRNVWIRYCLWRFDREAEKTYRMPAEMPPPRAASIGDMHAVVSGLILADPEKPTQALAEELARDLALDAKAILAQIKHIRGEQQGDYHFYG